MRPNLVTLKGAIMSQYSYDFRYKILQEMISMKIHIWVNVLGAAFLLVNGLSLPGLQNITQDCPTLGDGWFKPLRRSSFCYKFFWNANKKVSWTAARYHCRNITVLSQPMSTDVFAYMGSNLIWIENEEEEKFVLELLRLAARMEKEHAGKQKVAVWVNAHGYIYNRNGIAWANGNLIDSYDRFHRVDSKIDLDRIDCISLNEDGLLWGRTCESLLPAGIICKQADLSGSTSATKVLLPPECIRCISKPTDIKLLQLTNKKLSIESERTYFIAVEINGSWVDAYHKCGEHGLEFAWFQNLEEFSSAFDQIFQKEQTMLIRKNEDFLRKHFYYSFINHHAYLYDPEWDAHSMPLPRHFKSPLGQNPPKRVKGPGNVGCVIAVVNPKANQHLVALLTYGCTRPPFNPSAMFYALCSLHVHPHNKGCMKNVDSRRVYKCGPTPSIDSLPTFQMVASSQDSGYRKLFPSLHFTTMFAHLSFRDS